MDATPATPPPPARHEVSKTPLSPQPPKPVARLLTSDSIELRVSQNAVPAACDMQKQSPKIAVPATSVKQKQNSKIAVPAAGDQQKQSPKSANSAASDKQKQSPKTAPASPSRRKTLEHIKKPAHNHYHLPIKRLSLLSHAADEPSSVAERYYLQSSSPDTSTGGRASSQGHRSPLHHGSPQSRQSHHEKSYWHHRNELDKLRPKLPSELDQALASHSKWARLHFTFLPLLTYWHVFVTLFLDFVALFCLVEVAKYPDVGAVGPAWWIAVGIYGACVAVWLIGIVIVYELVSLSCLGSRGDSVLALPVYLSRPRQRLSAMRSYPLFSLYRRIRFTARPRDFANETCHFRSQDWPTVLVLLPRGIILTVFLVIYNPVSGSADNSRQASGRDNALFSPTSGRLTTFSLVVLLIQVAWTAWRTLLLLTAFSGRSILSQDDEHTAPSANKGKPRQNLRNSPSSANDRTDKCNMPYTLHWQDRAEERLRAGLSSDQQRSTGNNGTRMDSDIILDFSRGLSFATLPAYTTSDTLNAGQVSISGTPSRAANMYEAQTPSSSRSSSRLSPQQRGATQVWSSAPPPQTPPATPPLPTRHIWPMQPGHAEQAIREDAGPVGDANALLIELGSALQLPDLPDRSVTSTSRFREVELLQDEMRQGSPTSIRSARFAMDLHRREPSRATTSDQLSFRSDSPTDYAPVLRVTPVLSSAVHDDPPTSEESSNSYLQGLRTITEEEGSLPVDSSG